MSDINRLHVCALQSRRYIGDFATRGQCPCESCLPEHPSLRLFFLDVTGAKTLLLVSRSGVHRDCGDGAACAQAKSGLKVLGLRGGFGVMGMNSNAKPDPNAQSPQPASGTTTPRGGTAFTKIVYTKVPGETPKTVEVAGSWSKFKQRNAMTRNAAGLRSSPPLLPLSLPAFLLRIEGGMCVLCGNTTVYGTQGSAR